MKGRTILKVIFTTASLIFLLAFFCGLIGVVSFGIILLRAALCSVAAGVVAFIIYFIYDRFLAIDEGLLNEGSSSSDGFEAVSQGGADSYSSLYSSQGEDEDTLPASSSDYANQGGDIPSGISDGDLSLSGGAGLSSAELTNAVNAEYNEAMSDLDTIAEDLASLSSSGEELVTGELFSDDVKLEDIGGVDSTPSDYAKAIQTMLKKAD